MQFATSESSPAAPCSALQTISGELNATPAMPVALFALAAIVPETCVP
jgi:hypothetical protein